MRTFSRNLVGFLALLTCGICDASESAVVIVYQPIITESESHPKGFKILPIPFWWHSAQARHPCFAITHPNQLPTDAPRSERVDDRNLLSSAGIIIAGALEDGPVYVRFENLKRPLLANEEVTDDDIAEAALECIRRVAQTRRVQNSSSVARPGTRRSGRNGKSILSSTTWPNRSRDRESKN